MKIPTQLGRMISLLRLLEEDAPEGSAISMRLFSDFSGGFEFEVWGCLAAEAGFGKKFETDRINVMRHNPEWIAEIEAFVESLNKTVEKFNSSPPHSTEGNKGSAPENELLEMIR